jgi:hypothetical protein
VLDGDVQTYKHPLLTEDAGEVPLAVLSLLGGASLQISPHQVLAILDAHDTDWRAVAGRYFQNVHPWYGAVHAPVF